MVDRLYYNNKNNYKNLTTQTKKLTKKIIIKRILVKLFITIKLLT